METINNKEVIQNGQEKTTQFIEKVCQCKTQLETQYFGLQKFKKQNSNKGRCVMDKNTKDFLIKNVPVDLIKKIKLYAVEKDITMSEALVKVIDQKKIANS